jgi:branched-chain amino acid transport system ATP-binding protein
VNIHGSVVSAREIVLSTEGVAAGYGGDDIISNISVAVGKGSIFTVIGPNGSGKSTFIKVLAGLLPARTGEIRLGAMSIARLSAPQRVAAGLAYVPQEFNIFTNLTVGENLRVSTEFLERERRASTASACSPYSRKSPDGSGCAPATSRAGSARCSPSPAP